MSTGNKRKFERKDSLNMLHYVVLDDQGEPFQEGMGRSLNVSEKGLLLETHSPLMKNQMLSLTVGLKEDMVELKARVTYANPCENRAYCSGIEFLEIDENGKRVLNEFLKAVQNSMNDKSQK